MLDRELHAARVDRREGHQRQPADRVVADAVVDRVEHARHDRDLDAELLTALDQPADARVGDRGEGDDQVAHARAHDGLVEILDRAEHRHVAAADLGDRARVLVEEADRRQPVLGVVLQAPRDLRADDAGAHDQHGLADQPLRARPALGEGQHDAPDADAEQREQPRAQPVACGGACPLANRPSTATAIAPTETALITGTTPSSTSARRRVRYRPRR